MIRPETIDRAIDIVVAQCRPEQIYIVGSYSTGNATRTSDLDLLVVQRSTDAKPVRDARVELLLAPLLIPVDVNVYTPGEFEAERREPFGFARTATELQGRLVYSRSLGDFAELHRHWDGEPSAERHQRLQDAPGEWQLYQTQYARAAREWREPAWTYAAEVIGRSPDARVADLGCGERALGRALDRPIASFDHDASDPQTTVADLAAIPLGDACIDLAVLCIALVGNNWRDYLREATRILAPGGRLVITELCAGPRSSTEVTAALAGHGLHAGATRPRGPLFDIEARKAAP